MKRIRPSFLDLALLTVAAMAVLLMAGCGGASATKIPKAAAAGVGPMGMGSAQQKADYINAMKSRR